MMARSIVPRAEFRSEVQHPKVLKDEGYRYEWWTGVLPRDSSGIDLAGFVLDR